MSTHQLRRAVAWIARQVTPTASGQHRQRPITRSASRASRPQPAYARTPVLRAEDVRLVRPYVLAAEERARQCGAPRVVSPLL